MYFIVWSAVMGFLDWDNGKYNSYVIARNEAISILASQWTNDLCGDQ
jgi:hypothetical protein